MVDERKTAGGEDSASSQFWDALAPHHAALENNLLDVPSIRRVMNELREPVLVVGGGQGLIVAEIRKAGMQCDGIDLSKEMIRYARLRRGIELIHADARAMPFPDGAYETVIFATGVIDFSGDEAAIKTMLKEARRVVRKSGKVFVAFYKISAASESFLTRVGLLRNNTFAHRESLELYLLNPLQMVGWVARKGGMTYWSAAFLLMRMAARTTLSEKRTTFTVQKIFRKMSNPKSLIETAPESQPYRNEAEIRSLFNRLALQIKQIKKFDSCFIARIE